MEEIELDFGAITIDNATYKSEGYRFYEGLLAQMQQFKDSPVRVLQTDIVHNEAINHISEEIARTRTSITQALRSASKQLKIQTETIEDARKLLSIDGSENEIAKERLQNYYELIGAEKIDSEKHVNLSRLMEMYFSTEAPFESGKDKKHEFPDAIALLALEGWAEENNTKIIAVSQDKGWKSYSETSKRITLVSSLATALEKFQPHQKVAEILAHIREDPFLDRKGHVFEEVEFAIIDSIDEYAIWVSASSNLHFESEVISAAYISHELDKDEEDLIKARVVSINDEEIVIKVGATVELEVTASFDFSIRDSVDKDYVNMGGNIYTTTESYHTDILITLTGDFSKGFDEIYATEIEVLESLDHVEFGEIEPDWRNEYDDDDA